MTVSARACALEVLLGLQRGRTFASELLDRESGLKGLDPRERALAREIVYGVERHLRTLRHLVRAKCDVALEAIAPPVLAILLIGAYQILFLERIPPHAAVSATVDLARGARSRGFVNAVLRALLAEVERRLPAPEAAAGAAAAGVAQAPVPCSRILPLGGGRSVRFREDLLPDWSRPDPHALGVAFSYPDCLVRRWIERFGVDEARRLLEVSNEVPPLFLRANRLRTSRAELARRLGREGFEAHPPEGEAARAAPDALLAVGHGGLSALASFAEGLFTVQDLSAQLVTLALDARPGERILDLCAAPGGKATYLAELTNDAALIVAHDRSPERLALVGKAARRLGLASVALAPPGDATTAEGRPRGLFDRALVDVPCSNTGVLGRRVEARWRFPELDLEALAALQLALLQAACDVIKPGGSIVYSTCSLEEEENGQVVRRLLASRKDFVLDLERLIVPRSRGGDGAYFARLRRL